MFHINLDDSTNVSFSFQHYRNVNFEVRPGKFATDVTYCDFLLNGEEFSGLAVCVKGDPFKKETGRKNALARALKDAKLLKSERKQVWERYLHRPRPTGKKSNDQMQPQGGTELVSLDIETVSK